VRVQIPPSAPYMDGARGGDQLSPLFLLSPSGGGSARALNWSKGDPSPENPAPSYPKSYTFSRESSRDLSPVKWVLKGLKRVKHLVE
jgi:hypothetical protein